jgi:hypothetical protein
MYAYLMHYLWIVIVVRIFVMPFKLDFKAAVFVTLIGTELLILAFHLLQERIKKSLGIKTKPILN